MKKLPLEKKCILVFLAIFFALSSNSRAYAQGYALRFDGTNDLVTFGTVPIVSQHTIEAWIKTDSNTSAGIIVGQVAGPNQACSLGMHLRIDSNIPGYTVDISGCGNGFTAGESAINSGEWTHLAGTYDGDIMSLYINGQLEEQLTGIPFNPSSWMTAGAVTFFNGDQQFYSGDIDEIRIWNFARTSQEIQNTMNCHLVGTESGLIGYWKMDEGSGQQVGDSSLVGITGELGHNANIESSDPSWVASQAPIGNCSELNLTISPPSGYYVTTQKFDLTLIVDAIGLSVTGGSATFDGSDVTDVLANCIIPGSLISGGYTFRCSGITGGGSSTGTHTLGVSLDLSDGSNISDTVKWDVKENKEPFFFK